MCVFERICPSGGSIGRIRSRFRVNVKSFSWNRSVRNSRVLGESSTHFHEASRRPSTGREQDFTSRTARLAPVPTIRPPWPSPWVPSCPPLPSMAGGCVNELHQLYFATRHGIMVNNNGGYYSFLGQPDWHSACAVHRIGKNRVSIDSLSRIFLGDVFGSLWFYPQRPNWRVGWSGHNS